MPKHKEASSTDLPAAIELASAHQHRPHSKEPSVGLFRPTRQKTESCSSAWAIHKPSTPVGAGSGTPDTADPHPGDVHHQVRVSVASAGTHSTLASSAKKRQAYLRAPQVPLLWRHAQGLMHFSRSSRNQARPKSHASPLNGTRPLH